ncbi:hypothetical protein Q7C36_019852 [Tachysurus vachellii]|uniref:Chemokine interleukin-8-like domain-containing protein n=1 Tax=Tachysurus vachellii TaxID=175792 RepID=A0AA88LSI6_TACVA|nr:C-C motif chemokine 28-like [Tachysurus vachellii]KAK2823252.1 hypothetical protein Q7C36_019852 [Tachysurus vachellii]
MDFKILLLILCITFTAVQGFIPPCCIATAPIRGGLLKRVEKFTIQKINGRCDINALVLHVNGKRYCAPVKQKKLLQKLRPTLKEHENN